MPVSGLRRLARSWWAAVAAGLVFSALLAWHVMAVPPVYSAQVNALLLLPTSSVVPNTLATSSESVVDTAGVLQRMVGGQGSGAKPVSDSVTLSAQGIRHGFSVRLPNSGGQWADLYSDPFLDVQAVGSSEAEVQGEMQRVLVALEQGLRRMQDEEGVAPENRIGMQLNPGQPVIRAASGSRIRALGLPLGQPVCWGWPRRRGSRCSSGSRELDPESAWPSLSDHGSRSRRPRSNHLRCPPALTTSNLGTQLRTHSRSIRTSRSRGAPVARLPWWGQSSPCSCCLLESTAPLPGAVTRGRQRSKVSRPALDRQLRRAHR